MLDPRLASKFRLGTMGSVSGPRSFWRGCASAGEFCCSWWLEIAAAVGKSKDVEGWILLTKPSITDNCSRICSDAGSNDEASCLVYSHRAPIRSQEEQTGRKLSL